MSDDGFVWFSLKNMKFDGEFQPLNNEESEESDSNKEE